MFVCLLMDLSSPSTRLAKRSPSRSPITWMAGSAASTSAVSRGLFGATTTATAGLDPAPATAAVKVALTSARVVVAVVVVVVVVVAVVVVAAVVVVVAAAVQSIQRGRQGHRQGA